MNIEQFREYCLSVKGSTDSLPFPKHNVLVFKVVGEIFAYVSLEPTDGIFSVNLKCNPEKSIELRERYDGIAETDFKSLMWNLVTIESDVPDDLIEELVSHSVEEVIKKLPKKRQQEYYNM